MKPEILRQSSCRIYTENTDTQSYSDTTWLLQLSLECGLHECMVLPLPRYCTRLQDCVLDSHIDMETPALHFLHWTTGFLYISVHTHFYLSLLMYKFICLIYLSSMVIPCSSAKRLFSSSVSTGSTPDKNSEMMWLRLWLHLWDILVGKSDLILGSPYSRNGGLFWHICRRLLQNWVILKLVYISLHVNNCPNNH